MRIMAGGPALQDAFLTECQSKGTLVTVTLTNGGELRGSVKGFDPFTLLVEADHKTHLVYKHAISTVSPASPGKP
jgi:host factor-I protein